MSKLYSSQAVDAREPGKAHVDGYANAAQFPTEPSYSVNEIVYVQTSGQNQPDGPLVVKAIEDGNMYRLKWQSTGSEYHCLVPEDCLLVLS
ncbi:hypothetical protein BS50DRAFT_208651 [Corynespora cassiicola Philippines]|uniref:Hypervirulence associated protein TUDOR domain-containing protein n=1 Tax=Corynespora cassiicola Philippines TaxID=1448308 RepID=A0A2T2N4K4_CORCC|nr:hypothetical protein BS50DRAFT_208651 [Corynespora cassiicola Philippines]